jgi:hypothetical protein
MVMIYALTNIHRQMASIEQILWQNTFLGFPLQAGFSDTVIESEDFVYRSTNVSLTGNVQWTVGRWSHVLSPGGGYSRIADNDGEESAYYWKETGRYFSVSTEYTLSNLRQQPNELFGTGLEMYVGGISVLNAFEPRVIGDGRASVETRFPFRFILFGVYDGMGMDLHGVSKIYGGGQLATNYTLTEYPHPQGLELNWLAGGEAAMGLFSLEIQKNLSHLYFNRFFGTLSVRNVLYDGKGHPDANGITVNGDLRLIQSLRLKLGLKASVLPLIKQPVLSVEPYVWGAWKFSNSITGTGGLLHLSGGVNISF